MDKPKGVTSFSLVEAFRRDHGGPWPLKVVHGGALDPFAHGVLVLLVGAATRLFERLHELPKRYLAEVQWGAETDTGDGGGQVVRQADLVPSADMVRAALATFQGWHEQVPPATSNKRVGGERAYRLAHRGEAVSLPPSRVYLHEAVVRAHEVPGRSWLEVTVRGGFYVRSLVRDLGRALDTAAHLVGLERTAVGPWTRAGAPLGPLRGVEAAPWLETRPLSDAEWGALRSAGNTTLAATQGARWPWPTGFPPAGATGYLHQGRLVAVQAADGLTVLPGGV